MRANRYHIPGCIWHIAHRCHKGEILLSVLREDPVSYGTVLEGETGNLRALPLSGIPQVSIHEADAQVRRRTSSHGSDPGLVLRGVSTARTLAKWWRRAKLWGISLELASGITNDRIRHSPMDNFHSNV